MNKTIFRPIIQKKKKKKTKTKPKTKPKTERSTIDLPVWKIFKILCRSANQRVSNQGDQSNLNIRGVVFVLFKKSKQKQIYV